MSDVLDVALLVAIALESVGADYVVGGSVASSLQGEPRATNDIVEVLRVSGRQLSRDYLDSWARRLAVTDLLSRAEEDARA